MQVTHDGAWAVHRDGDLAGESSTERSRSDMDLISVFLVRLCRLFYTQIPTKFQSGNLMGSDYSGHLVVRVR
jgi:hypothetical protein